MRLLFIVQDSQGWAGTERVLNLVANALSADRDVEVLSLSPRRESGAGYPYLPAVARSWLPAKNGPGGIFATNFSLAAHIARGRYDAVILAGIGEIKFLVAALAARKSRFAGWEHFNAAYTHRRLNRKLAARRLDAVIVLSKRDEADWHRLLAPKAVVVRIPNPIPALSAGPGEMPAAVPARRILALGRLEEQKRFDLLLEAFALFRQSHPDWNLRIRGAGSLEPALRAQAEALELGSAIEILPPTAEVLSEYRSASIYAMSSKFEGFPMTLIEAMAQGLPCVSFDCPNGPSEIIMDGEDGIVVPLFDTTALAGGFSRLASDEGLRAAFATRARENVRRYEIDRILPLWNEFLEKLCAP
jgi:glycosyltransferase involved in cell wall biosynthesis